MSTEDYMPCQRRFCLPVQTLQFLCATLAGKQCAANLTAAGLVITLRLLTGTFTVAVEVLLVGSSQSTKVRQNWILYRLLL